MPSAGRWPARLLVLLLHALLLGALWLDRPARHKTPREWAVTTLRLIPPRAAAPPPAPVLSPRLPVLGETTPEPPRLPDPAAAQTEPARGAPSEPAAPPPSVEPGRSTLRLGLPTQVGASPAHPDRHPARNPALSDPRSNTPRRTLEDKLADAMGGADGQWHEERMGDSRSILRRGDTCIEVFKSRIADTTNAFDQSMNPTPKMFGKPYRCR